MQKRTAEAVAAGESLCFGPLVMVWFCTKEGLTGMCGGLAKNGAA